MFKSDEKNFEVTWSVHLNVNHKAIGWTIIKGPGNVPKLAG